MQWAVGGMQLAVGSGRYAVGSMQFPVGSMQWADDTDETAYSFLNLLFTPPSLKATADETFTRLR